MRQNPYLAHYFSASPNIGAGDTAAGSSPTKDSPFVHSLHMRQRVFRPSARTIAAFTPACTPPLSPSGRRYLTPVEANGRQYPQFGLSVNGMQGSPQIISPQVGKVEGFSNWESMMKHSHAVIAQAKELLDVENSSEVINMGRSSTQPAYMASRADSKVGKYTPDGVISNNLDHTKIVKKAEETPKEPNSVLPQGGQEVEVDKRHIESNSKTVCLQLNPPVCNDYDMKVTQVPVVSATPEVKCLVVTLNHNSSECVAKRLTRRPSYVFAFQKNHNLIVSDLNEHPRIPCVTAEEKLASKPRSKKENTRSSSKEKKKKEEGVISVSSLYGLLERLADVVHPRFVDPVGSSTKKIGLDVSPERRRHLNNSLEDYRDRGGSQRGDHAWHSVPAPQVIMGSAPRININETSVSNGVSVPDAVVPTSQLAMCGVSPRRVFPQRTPSARRSNLNRTSKTPGYALPTESWICKGAELSDVHVETTSISNEITPKGPPH